MSDTLPRLIAVTTRFLEDRPGDWSVTRASAICQDLLISGIDVDDYVASLDREFGKVVLEVPWRRFTDQTASFRGAGCLAFPFWLFWRLLRLPFRGGPVIPHPDPRGHPYRLTLAHLAAVIDAGRWFEPDSAR